MDHAIVVLWSDVSVKSEWVRAEAEEGANRKILILAVIERNVVIPLRFRSLQAAQLIDWQEPISKNRAFELLVDAIKRLADPSTGTKPRRGVTNRSLPGTTPKDRDVFLGYSSGSIHIARSIRDYIGQELRAAVLEWAMDFRPGVTILEQVQEAADRCKTAVFLFTKDDPFPVRYNLIFEFGFFVHALGRERVLVMLEEGVSLLADVGGFSYLTFEDKANVTKISTGIRAWFT